MQNEHHRRKITRGSSPSRELAQGRESWVRGLRSVKPAPEHALHERSGAGNEDTQKMEFVARDTAVAEISHDESRWQDDGGEGG
jgi:hypothetical protein